MGRVSPFAFVHGCSSRASTARATCRASSDERAALLWWVTGPCRRPEPARGGGPPTRCFAFWGSGFSRPS